MILLKDVTHYTVGPKEFPVGLVVYDENQRPWRGQGFRTARQASINTGMPVVAHGRNSVRVKGAKVAWEYGPAPALDTPEQIAALIANA